MKGFGDVALWATARTSSSQSKSDTRAAEVNRNNREIVEALLTGSSLQRCRQQLKAAGYEVRTAEGAFIFVHPYQMDDVQRTLVTIPLKASNIIFARSLENLIAETLDTFRCQGAWISSRDSLLSMHSAGSTSAEPASLRSGETERSIEGVIEHIRTFLRWHPASRAQPVTASTTDADSGKGPNPRRTVELL